MGDQLERNGIGSGSAFTVRLLNAFYGYKGQQITFDKLAHESIYIEQRLVGKQVGSQDQVSAIFGGLNGITFALNDQILVGPIAVERERFTYLYSNFIYFMPGSLARPLRLLKQLSPVSTTTTTRCLGCMPWLIML